VKYFVAFAHVRSDGKRAAAMVQHDRNIGKRAGQIGELGDLGVVDPRIEGEIERGEAREALAELLICHQVQ
jgi:hypothetical protein